MFGRFAGAVRAAVVDAHARAQAERAPGITEDHVLAALLTGPRSVELLAAVVLTPDDAAQVLEDVAAARRGHHRLCASRGFQEVLGSAVKRARALGDRELRAEHLLLALAGRRDLVAEALAARGVTVATVLDALDRARRGAA